jgi:hypothetical protein
MPFCGVGTDLADRHCVDSHNACKFEGSCQPTTIGNGIMEDRWFAQKKLIERQEMVRG